MKTNILIREVRRQGRQERCGGFTMIEIALSLAIVAFALVAILGVLPTGMQVQKDNREDTLINQDGQFLLEAIRSGSHGIDDLTNYFESITLITTSASQNVTNEWVNVTSANQGTPPGLLTDGATIVGLLTQPKFVQDPADANLLITNRVLARVRSINGAAAEKGAMSNEFAFRYQMQVDIVPHVSISLVDTNVPAGLNPVQLALFQNEVRKQINEQRNLTNNLHALRVVLRWPLYERGNQWVPGRHSKTFRTLVGGKLTNELTGIYFRPNTFLNANANL